jgi:diaminobutyrate-2-oxoglutarate transaminase
MYTTAKADFLRAFDETILKPRGLDYKVQFPGPAGNNAVEAALKLARKYTGRETVVSFTNAFHGMTLGALAVTGNSMKRSGAGIPLAHGAPMPYDQFLDGRTPDFLLFERMLTDSGSGLDKPAAVIVETVQGEGGINVGSHEWLRGLADLCKRHDILLIVDDIQMGCGRTGPFFSFEAAGITPDIVCMSKSLSGIGLPLAITLFNRGLDVWEPGEHNGTFRGFNPAFVTATAALGLWPDDHMEKQTLAKGDQLEERLTEISGEHADLGAVVRGRGLAWGLAFDDPTMADAVCAAAFEAGLLIETAGALGEVAKFMPPLTITEDELDAGLDIVARAVRTAREALGKERG